MSVPNVKLNDGTSIPAIGFGTGEFGFANLLENQAEVQVPDYTDPNVPILSILLLMPDIDILILHRPIRMLDL